MKNEYTSLSNYRDAWLYNHDSSCAVKQDNLKYDYDYILEQLNIGYNKGLLGAEK